MYAHNGKKFDSYLLLQCPDLKFSSIVKTASGIISLTVEGQNAKFIFKCTLAHFQFGSLASLCSQYDIDKKYYKSEFDHSKVNCDNWYQFKSEWLPYLKFDVISLCLVWKKYVKSMHEVSKQIGDKRLSVLVKNTCSSPGFAW